MRYRSADYAMAKGELLRRMEANLNRLEQREYDLEYVRIMDKNGWPGDYRGRTLLAMTQLSCMLDRQCTHLKPLAEDILGYLEERGYGGDELNLDAINEQQLAGHSWLIRGLMAYGKFASDVRFEAAARRMFEHLFLPVSAYFSIYPIPNTDSDVGDPSGTLIGRSADHWMLSSDCGCVFIALDGLSDYYAHTGDERACRIFTALADRFFELNPMRAGFQTHATLSALRGLMRMYELTGETRYLDVSVDRFDMYLNNALTLNYANYNWFGRPRWTECCAVVDSYILSLCFFQQGLGDRYIETAERILYNGLMAGQRENGGFGSDCCLVADGSVPRLTSYSDCYEAFWCCSMRGAEGLTAAVRNSVCLEGNAIHIAGWHPGEYHIGDVRVMIQGDFPWEDRGSITVTGKNAYYDLHLYPVDSAISILRSDCDVIREEIPFLLKVKSGEMLEVSFDLGLRRKQAGNGRIHWKGPLMLDQDQRPLSHRMYMPVEELKNGMQIIF